jgi:hypothetical protein
MKGYAPETVGVPAIAPSVSVRPVGSVPLVSDHVYVPVPPDTTSIASNGAVTSPTARRASVKGSELAMVTGSRTTTERFFVSLRTSPFIFASTWKSNWPAAVGVPEMRPVPASIASPGGSAPEAIDQVFASATDAVICSEYGVPVVAGVVDSGPIVSFASPRLTLMMNSSSDVHFDPQVAAH